MPTDYANGKIYRIVCNVTGLTYIGSTTQTLAQRLTQHRSYYKSLLANPDKKKRMPSSWKVIESDDYDIVLIESCKCETKDELHRRERHYIETMDCVNNNVPARAKVESQGAYYESNRGVILEKKKLKTECGCGKTYTHGSTSRHLKSNKHRKWVQSKEWIKSITEQ
jgi:hypothetical protein